MCFHCKGGLYNIDVDDDPVKDHVTFYGHCAYIKDYCSRHGIVNDQVPKPLSEAMFTEDEQNLLMEHPLIKVGIFIPLDSRDIRLQILFYRFWKFHKF